MEIIQLISLKLNKFGVNLTEEEIGISLEEVDQFIKNYCHIDYIPDALLYVRSNMVVDYIRFTEANKPIDSDNLGNTNAAKLGPLTSIKAGNVSYNFADSTGNKNSIGNAHTADLDSLLHNYIYQLNAFRRVVW